MSVFVHVTFDLFDANAADYACVHDGLENLALTDFVYSSKGKYIELPYNTFGGEYENVTDIVAFADLVKVEVKRVFANCNVTGRVFVLVAGKTWAWRSSRF
jgi:hypothetical protein